jgi:hypothetical protein
LLRGCGSAGLGKGIGLAGGVEDSLELREEIQEEAELRRGTERVVSIWMAWCGIFSRLLRWRRPGRLEGMGFALELWPLLVVGTLGAGAA